MRRISLITVFCSLFFNAALCTTSTADVFVNFTNPPQAKVVEPNPPTAEISAYAVLNSQNDNTVVAVDGYNSVIYGLFLAAQNGTFEKLDDLTQTADRQNIQVQTPALNEEASYSNTTVAICQNQFNQIFLSRFRNFGGKTITGLEIGKNLDLINNWIEKRTGIKGAIESVPNDEDSVVLLSVVNQKTNWKNKMTQEKINWLGHNVNGFVGRIPVSTTTAPNGATIYHLKMDSGTIMSICFIADLDEQQVGEWLPESALTSNQFKEMTVHLPSLELKREFNFREFEPLKFLFTNEATLLFGNREQKLYSAKQLTSFVLNEHGLDAKSVTYAVSISKGLFVPPKAELSFDRPFVATFSYVRQGRVMPTFAIKVLDPSRNK